MMDLLELVGIGDATEDSWSFAWRYKSDVLRHDNRILGKYAEPHIEWNLYGLSCTLNVLTHVQLPSMRHSVREVTPRLTHTPESIGGEIRLAVVLKNPGNYVESGNGSKIAKFYRSLNVSAVIAGAYDFNRIGRDPGPRLKIKGSVGYLDLSVRGVLLLAGDIGIVRAHNERSSRKRQSHFCTRRAFS